MSIGWIRELCACAGGCAQTHGCPWRPGDLDPLELELQAVVISLTGTLETKLASSA